MKFFKTMNLNSTCSRTIYGKRRKLLLTYLFTSSLPCVGFFSLHQFDWSAALSFCILLGNYFSSIWRCADQKTFISHIHHSLSLFISALRVKCNKLFTFSNNSYFIETMRQNETFPIWWRPYERIFIFGYCKKPT